MLHTRKLKHSCIKQVTWCFRPSQPVRLYQLRAKWEQSERLEDSEQGQWHRAKSICSQKPKLSTVESGHQIDG